MEDISVTHRIKDTGCRNPDILVKFLSKRKRNELLRASKVKSKKTKLTTSDIGFPGECKNIYIDENLTSYRSFLFRSARRSKEVNHYKYVWIRNGNVYMRKDENNPVLLIKSPECIPK